ncbi:GAF domain-containing protein [Desertivirga arenae]|uniref:GAF domain-containing protein n=1 Tax=Desertivirga arenae TaxID=2810309 RepID=UPI001A97356E|nr:GAF domain-containing protein [Pedobacter sp. SYSU D00823]
MRTEILDLSLIDKEINHPGSSISFEPFISYMEGLAAGQGVKASFYKSLASKFKGELDIVEEIKVEELSKYTELLELIYMFLTPLVSAEDDHLWALATPIPSKVLLSTDAFYNFHACESNCTIAGAFDAKNIFSDKEKAFMYRVILQKLFNISAGVNSDSYIQTVNPLNNQPIYYKVNIDTRFIQVSHHEPLPKVSPEQLESWLWEVDGQEKLEKILPLSSFSIKGFSILELEDITSEHAIESLKDILVQQTLELDYEALNLALQSLVGTAHVDFGLLPFLQLNGKTVYLNESCTNSILMSSARSYRVSQNYFHEHVERYRNNGRAIFLNNLSGEGSGDPVLRRILRQSGIEAFALVPILFKKKMIGALELYSKEQIVLSKLLTNRLKPALPYVAQLLEQTGEEFQNTIDNAVRDNYTSLKTSVKWKFNEAVWKQMQEHSQEPARIVFKDLYPFYGAIDIRQSTVERNKAAFEDLSQTINHLERTFDLLINLKEGEELEERLPDWRQHFDDYKSGKDEHQFNHVLESDIHPVLSAIAERSKPAAEVINDYFIENSHSKGILHKNRRELELSMQKVNAVINQTLLKDQKDLQREYSHYFDKFRTDGVEYDIYLGQSIVPERAFNRNHLEAFRLWQVKSMAEIGRITSRLAPTLPKPLLTTQLIFVHSHPIDISYRNDEKRFDVDGGYSIRYQVVKKRIDKVHIDGTDERLTQPEKIAIVYAHEAEKDEYKAYIHRLQEKGILEHDLEELDLEELQGVNGLKALRVGIVL